MSLDEQTLRSLFERSQQSNGDKMQFTPEESSRFQKSFEDPEFRKLFADYMDELSDPKNREETEAYISQLEGEQKVPEGKELIRPEPVFVAKSYKEFKKDKKDKEKVFLNIVQSGKINTPSKTDTPKGTCWSVPYSLGPPHMEKDKNGDNAPCFDCCFHPEAIRLGMQHKEFKDLLVTTAMEGVEKLYQQQGQDVTIAREFHVVKGINYKQGQVPTMMIAVASKENWNDRNSAEKVKSTKPVVDSKLTPPARVKETTPSPPSHPNPVAAKPAPGPAIKKGFLSNSKGAIYGDKLTTIRPKKEPEGATSKAHAGISLVDSPLSGSSLDSLNIPSAATAAKSKNAGNTPGIQEVKKSDSCTAPATSTTSAAAGQQEKMATRRSGSSSSSSNNAVPGMTAVSTTKRQPAPSPATPQLGSPSGSRDISATSPAGSDVALEESDDTSISAPKYTMKERGHISMGDFENMNTTARSNRPSELVYRVELPKISKAALIVLDIAERQLNLSYPEVYSLSVKLPYPVFDTKGTAKYDKASKSLTITLPVRPPPAPLHPAPVSAPATPVKQQGMGEEGSAENENGESGPAKGATPAATVRKSPSAGHSRWVEKPPSSSSSSSSSAADAAAGADAGSKPPASPLSLKEEVLRQAEIALKSAQEAAAKAAQEAAKVPPPAYQKATQCVPSAPTVPANAVPTAAVEPLGQEFLASATFKGMKAGYVFKKGDRGQGYYLDSKSAPHSAAPAPTTQPTPAVFPKAETTPAAASAVPITTTTVTAVYQEIPFECRQTKQALAVIVEVPHIDKSSVAVHFQTYSVSVNFRAFVDVSNGTTNIDTVQYGSVLRLSPTDCAGGLDVAMCRFDVADHNMAVVLTKALPAYWHNSSSAAAADKAFADSSASESKSGDFSSREARGLLEMLPFEAPAGASSVSAKGSCSLSAAQKSDTSSLTKADADATLKSLRNHIQSLQFSSSDALFELD